MAVTLTEKAAAEFKKIVAEQKLPAETCLRFQAAAGGCSGFSYGLAFDTNYDPTQDMKTEFFGVSLLVDKKSETYLDGTIIDFYDGLERRGFHFKNPQAVKTCGCGSSFSV